MRFTKNIKDVIFLSTSNFISSLALGLFLLYLASLMDKTQYGELGLLMSIANVGAVVSLFGLRTMITVYEPKKENVIPAAFVFVLISSAISAVIVYIITYNVALSLLLFGLSLFMLILSGFNSQKRYSDFSKHRLVRPIITIALALILYEFYGINGILLGYFVGTLFILKDLHSLLKNRTVDFSVLKPKIKFMSYLFTKRLSDVFIQWGDRIVIGALFGFTILGSYHFAAQYLFLLGSLSRSMFVYLLPHEAEGKKNKKIKFLAIIVAVMLGIISIIIIPFAINAILPKYQESIIPMQILSIAIVPLTITAIQDSEFLGKEKSRVILVGSFIQSGLYMGLLVALGQEFGLAGMASGFLVAVVSRTIYNFVVKSRIQQ